MATARSHFVDDPISGRSAEVRKIQPYMAIKIYLCPGCSQEIAKGIGHLVVVPLGSPRDRRHWHSSCWEQRSRRPPRS